MIIKMKRKMIKKEGNIHDKAIEKSVAFGFSCLSYETVYAVNGKRKFYHKSYLTIL